MLSKNTILIPQVSGSEEVDLNGIEFLLRQQCPEMFSGNYYPTGGLFPEGAVLVNGDFGEELNGDLTTVTTMANTLSAQTKPPAKKDRHSKIFTAQGPRDRRVRLSIDIARRFFDLQEMLGFDKPSKTLDWLLTKSRAAINELAQTKQNGSGSSLSEYDEAAAVSYDTGEAFENGPNSVKTPKTKDPAASHTSSKESRAKARARARERTREKMCIKQLNGGCGSLSIPTQNWDNQFEDFRSSAGPSSFNPNAGLSQPILACALNNADLIHESIVVQRKPKNPSFWGFQQNLNAASAVAAAENGDICSFSTQSNMCAIWDHHKKFFNSTSSNQ